MFYKEQENIQKLMVTELLNKGKIAEIFMVLEILFTKQPTHEE